MVWAILDSMDAKCLLPAVKHVMGDFNVAKIT